MVCIKNYQGYITTKRISALKSSVIVAMVYCPYVVQQYADTNALMCVMKAMSFYPSVKPVILFPVYKDKFVVSLISESRGGI